MIFLQTEDQVLLLDICKNNGIDVNHLYKLIEIEGKYIFKERRTGIYSDIREVLESTEISYSGD